MEKIRIRYTKTGKGKYISHLDLMTVMQRAFIRDGAVLKYSEGFNPHPYISVALPAPVGTDSLCEVMDAAFAGGTLSKDINNYLPEGLEVLKTYRPWRSFDDIKWIDVQCRLIFAGKPPLKLDSLLTERFTADSLIITKKTKKGISEIDAAPHIRDAVIGREGGYDNCIFVSVKISAQNPTINSKDIEQIIKGIYIEKNENISYFDYLELKRIEIYDKNMVIFK